jgi:hypothetical protein
MLFWKTNAAYFALYETGEWERLRKKELNDLYSSNTIRVTKIRKMSWAGHMVRMGD